MSLYDKPLPHNDSAEKTIIGAILLNPKYIEYCHYLSPDDFYHPKRRPIFEAMWEIYQEGREITVPLIQERLPDHVSASFLMAHAVESAGLVITKNSVSEAVEVVKGHSVSRQALFMVHRIERAILEEDEAVGTVIQKAESEITKLTDRLYSQSEEDAGFYSLRAIVPDLAEQFSQYHANVATGVPTGMTEIDEMLDGGGLQNGAMYVLGASEKVGKTSLVLDWADYTAKETKRKVLISTLEMSRITMGKRLFSKHSGISYYKFRPGFANTKWDKSYTQAFEDLDEFGLIPIEIADNLFGLSQIATYFRRAVERGHRSTKPEDTVGLGIIDYLQLISDDTGQSTANREREVAKISRRLRMLSVELGIPLLVISNLNREGLGEGQRPSTRNLRDSGSIGFDAEAVMFLYNPAFVPGKPYQPMPVTDIEFIIDRQRNGPTGTVLLKFVGQYMRFLTQKQYAEYMSTSETPVVREDQGGIEAPAREIISLGWDEDDDD